MTEKLAIEIQKGKHVLVSGPFDGSEFDLRTPRPVSLVHQLYFIFVDSAHICVYAGQRWCCLNNASFGTFSTWV